MTSDLLGPYAQALAWALVHFLWQGALLGLAAVWMMRAPRFGASARYAIGVASLAAMFAAPIATTAWLSANPAAGWTAMTPALTSSGRALARPTASASTSQLRGARGIEPRDSVQSAFTHRAAAARPVLLPVVPVLVVWLAGVALLTARLAGNWLAVRRLIRHSVRPVDVEIHRLARRMAGRLALDRVVRISESTRVAVPLMVGWLKPVVLLPASAMAGLAPTQIEALIAHELAHVRRHDYLVNLLQSAVETLLFYHPAVWWVSKRVRAEREHCCDDVAVSICDRLVYARALSDLAEMAAPQLAMAASNGSLVERVRRILGRPSAESTGGAGWVPVFVILTLVAPVLSAPMTPRQQTAASSPATTTAAATTAPAATQAPTPIATSMAVPAIPTVAPQTTAPPAKPVTTHTLAATTPEQQRDIEIAELRARLQQLENEQHDLDQKRSALEMSKNEAQAKAQIDDLRAQLDRTSVQLQRARKQVELGLAPEESVADLEMLVQKLQRELQAVQAAREYDIASAQLEARAADQKREYDRLMQEYSLVAQARENLTTRPNLEDVTDPGAEIRENDVLMIQISGEPDLPESYRVQSDGTIRLPLMPALKVSGLTTAQAGEAVVKLLGAHHLVANPQVSVRLRRAR